MVDGMERFTLLNPIVYSVLITQLIHSGQLHKLEKLRGCDKLESLTLGYG